MGRRQWGELGFTGVLAMLLGLLCAAAAPPGAAAAGPDDFAGVQATDGYDTDNPARRGGAYAREGGTGLHGARVWFEWSAIETQPGKYDFSRYDPLMEDA